MKNLFKLVSFLILATLLFTGCNGDEEIPLVRCDNGERMFIPCDSDESMVQLVECEDNQYKNLGECSIKGVVCNYDTDCESGNLCNEGLCENQECECEAVYEPVCGKNGKTYSNSCVAGCESAELKHEGECEDLKKCSEDSECDEGKICTYFTMENKGVCIDGQRCNEDNECSENELCIAGLCQENDKCEDVMCELYCENGFKKDEHGCDICECVENDVPDSECLSDADCSEGEFCQLPLGCYIDENNELVCPDDQKGVCMRDELPNQCQSDADCVENQVCIEGVCKENETPDECQTDNDCAENQHCEIRVGCYIDENGEQVCPGGNICVDNDIPNECQSDADCSEGDVCLDSVCVSEQVNCQSDADCANNEICAYFVDSDTGICEIDENSCQTDSDCAEGESCLQGYCLFIE